VIGALDGNNSLKRFVRDGHQSSPLTFESDYFLSHEYVDVFKNEIKRKAQAPGHVEVSELLLLAFHLGNLQQVEVEGDPTDGHTGLATCTDRWRAANADNAKGMYHTFQETGIFVSVCRNGLIWTIVDMMRSSEL
jgi:Kyakuja-Dileera-Zisupton transposase